MKYAVITFGCRVNQADSIGFEEVLRAAGAVGASAEDADLVVVNTCSVTATSDQGARQAIRRVARQNPQARIVVTGCYATRRPGEVADLPNVVRVIPNEDKPRLLELIRRIPPSTGSPHPELDERRLQPDSVELSTADRFGQGDGSCGATLEPGIAGRTAFTLRVQTGCAERCAYCIIPATRGQPRSVPIAGLLAEVGRVVAAGFKEIALTGVHLGSYGRDLTPGSSLGELLRALDRTPRGLDPLLFRISSLEPMDCSREIVDLVASPDRFAPHFHLPLQHASNRVLASMKRPYTVEYYSSLVDDIRARIPDSSIGSDIIVGFPGETDADFEQLVSYLAGSPLTHLHVFPYSDRPGTSASVMRAKVEGAVVRDRSRVVRDIGQRLTRTFRRSQVGTIRRALTLEDGSLVVTDNYLKVRIPPGRARNEWVRIRMSEAGDPMRGEMS